MKHSTMELVDEVKSNFDKRMAGELIEDTNTDIEFANDNGETIIANVRIDDGTEIKLTYKLNIIKVNVAEYSVPNPTHTSPPDHTEWFVLYGNETTDEYDIILADDDGKQRNVVTDGMYTMLMDHAICTEIYGDFIAVEDVDISDPVGNQYYADWMLVQAVSNPNSDDENELFRHPKYDG